jgi:outer membrane protein TolC
VRPIAAALAVAVAACLAAGNPARADTPALDLKGAVSYALAHSPSILAKRATVANDESQFAKLHAQEYPPIVASLQNQLEKSSNVAGAFQQYGLTQAQAYSQNTAQIGTNWTIYNGSLLQMQTQSAKRTMEAARDDLKRAEQQTAQDVTSAFYAIASKREAVRLAQADLAYQTALLNVAEANERVGRAAGVDVLRAHANQLRSQATLVSAISDEATARETLASTIGAPPDQPFAVEAVLPEPHLPTAPLASLIAVARANRSDIASAKASLDAAKLVDSQIDTDRLPQFSLNASFGNQFSPTAYGTLLSEAQSPAFGGNPSVVVPRGNLGFWQIGASETLNIGLIDWGARRAQHRAARAGIESAAAALTAAVDAVETDVRQALRGAQTADANLATAKEAAAYGIESARIAQLQYKNGLISLTDAVSAEQTSLSSQNDLVNARVTYIDAIVHLRVSLGTADPLAVVDLRNS